MHMFGPGDSQGPSLDINTISTIQASIGRPEAKDDSVFEP